MPPLTSDPTCNGDDEELSAWVGIDGYGDGDTNLIHAGPGQLGSVPHTRLFADLISLKGHMGRGGSFRVRDSRVATSLQKKPVAALGAREPRSLPGHSWHGKIQVRQVTLYWDL